jgi:energy-coupling factor transporter ATP-binding protein EcfA2
VSEQIIYTKEELANLSDEKLLTVLRMDWNFADGEKILAWGLIKKKDGFDKLSDERTEFHIFSDAKAISTNRGIEYPISNIYRTISQFGIFISKKEIERIEASNLANTSIFVRCELILSPYLEREKHDNPLEVNVRDGSIEKLIELPNIKSDEVISENFHSYISECVSDFYVQKNKTSIEKEHNAFKESLEKEFEDLNSNKSTIQNEITLSKLELEQANNKIIEAEKKAQGKLAAAEKSLAKQQKKREKIILEIQSLMTEESELQNEIQALMTSYEKYEGDMSKKLEKLKNFIESKAVLLKELEFIDEEEFNNLLPGGDQEDSSEELLSFSDDFDGDYAKSVSYIQAYLAAQDIIYPRYVLEDFFALIQTNDLIVLTGDSGSGKTNLVQSFARAVGGVSKIIPVKPNWTSSEDLLGYYNPLEKKYLSTPFLDALIEAGNNPDVPYLICLDEMNLARVEYYFADFLSKLEERDELPEIYLYSDDESSHTLSEFKNVIQLITNAKEKYKKKNIINFAQLLQDEEINAELKRVFGFSDKDSLIKYHSDLRRMLGGVINTPSTIRFPANVRIIGAINIDETTHYLSPKILDRAHVMKFESPLLHDWMKISQEVKSYGFDDVNKKIRFSIEDLGIRASYPKFETDNDFCSLIVDFTKDCFAPLGVEVGLRTIRQGLNYLEMFSKFNSDNDLYINNFFIHKILPKLTFDGNKKVGDSEKYKILRHLKDKLSDTISITVEHGNCVDVLEELQKVIDKAESNDWIVNYWS